MFLSYCKIVTPETTLVSGYMEHYQAYLSVQEISLKTDTPLILTQIIQHTL